MSRFLCGWFAAAGLVLGCQGDVGPSGPMGMDPDPPTPPGSQAPPLRQSVGTAEFPEARNIARMTADQFHRSLEVATGQRWADFERYAAALGRPDFAEVTEQGEELSVTFDKLIHDAARATCTAAVTADVEGSRGPGTILREVHLTDRDPQRLGENIKYLFLRFLATEIVDDDDPRLTPWLNVVLAPGPDGAELTNEQMALRWSAVCIGLATHPDFLSY
ncbi:MAG: hypothetical protein AAGF12_17285 [Myxococcota bacterium]